MRSFEADKKSPPGTPPLNGVFYFPYFQNFFFGEAEPPFLYNLSHSAIIRLYGRGGQLVEPKFGFLPLSILSHV